MDGLMGADLPGEYYFLTGTDESVRLQLAMVLLLSRDQNLQDKVIHLTFLTLF